jgi:hypothetical protein
MSGASIAQQAGEAAQALGTWHPDDGEDADATLGALADMFESWHAGLQALIGNLHDEPIDPGVMEEIEEVASNLAGGTEGLRSAYASFRAKHEVELRRIEEPRPDEQMWNV